MEHRTNINPVMVDKLVKILCLLGSPYDGECLQAARTAHGLLTKYGLNWKEILLPFRNECTHKICEKWREDNAWLFKDIDDDL